MKNFSKKYKRQVGAVLIAPFCWELFEYGWHGTPPILINLVAMVGLVLASLWFVYGFSRGFEPVTVPPRNNSRIKKSTRLALGFLSGQLGVSAFIWFAFAADDTTMPTWFKIGMLIFINVTLFRWFLQQRSPDKESFNPKPW